MRPIFIEFKHSDGAKSILFNVSLITSIVTCGDPGSNKAMIYSRGSGIVVDCTYEEAIGKLRKAIDNA